MFLISGSTGRVGSNVVAELLKHDQPVRALARSEESLKQWSAQGVETAAVDLLDSAALSEALKGAEGFFALLPFHFGDRVRFLVPVGRVSGTGCACIGYRG